MWFTALLLELGDHPGGTSPRVIFPEKSSESGEIMSASVRAEAGGREVDVEVAFLTKLGMFVCACASGRQQVWPLSPASLTPPTCPGNCPAAVA